jgi:hypothetical protein
MLEAGSFVSHIHRKKPKDKPASERIRHVNAPRCKIRSAAGYDAQA